MTIIIVNYEVITVAIMVHDCRSSNNKEKLIVLVLVVVMVTWCDN